MIEIPLVDGMPIEQFLQAVGETVINNIHTTFHLGHTHPGATLDYWFPQEDSTVSHIVRDYVDWTSRRNVHPGARDRLEMLIENLQWNKVQSHKLTMAITGHIG